MTTRRLFQYATSTDPEVVAAVTASEDRWTAFREAALAWARERGSDEAGLSRFAGRLAVSGLPGKPEGFGQWTKPNDRGLSVPFKNNIEERSVMDGLTVEAIAVPGLPGLLYAPGPNYGSYVMQPKPFVSGGAAWVGLNHAPVESENRNRGDFGPQWRECLASEFHAAVEARS